MMTRTPTPLGVLAACWLGLLIVAAGATAATATFSASFEAERSATWLQPRGVDLIDCHGQHYYAANGEDRNAPVRGLLWVAEISDLGYAARGG
jgi:hypothetical protein